MLKAYFHQSVLLKYTNILQKHKLAKMIFIYSTACYLLSKMLALVIFKESDMGPNRIRFECVSYGFIGCCERCWNNVCSSNYLLPWLITLFSYNLRGELLGVADV